MKQQKTIVYANEFAPRDGVLRVHFIGHPSYEGKTDGFLIQYGSELYLIDGGYTTVTDVRDYLLGLRASFLKDHPELVEDPSCKLRLHWLLSHFHSDHALATIVQMMPDPYFSFGDLYLPPDATIHPDYTCPGFDGDENVRPKLAEALCSSTSNCSTPTTPTMISSKPMPGRLNVWMVPSSASCTTPLTNCFLLRLSMEEQRAKNSGAKTGMPS